MPADTAAAAPGDSSTPAALPTFDAALSAAVASTGFDTGASETADADTNAATSPTDTEQTSADTLEEGRSDDASEETDEGEETADAEDESTSPTAADEESSPKLKKLLEGVPEAQREGVRKYIDAAIQPKFQKIAAQSKILASLERDPKGTALAILNQLGEVAPASPNGTAETQTSDIEAGLKDAGFNETQIKALAPILQGVQAEVDGLRASEAARVTEQDVEAFKREHADYDELEPAMNSWFDRIKPADNMDTRTYLGILRTLALGDRSVGDRTKKIFKKVVDNAKAAGPKPKSVPADAVKPAQAGPLSWDQSVELANQGVTVGRGLRR